MCLYYPSRVTDVRAGLAVISVVADLALSACDRRADLVEATRSKYLDDTYILPRSYGNGRQ